MSIIPFVRVIEVGSGKDTYFGDQEFFDPGTPGGSMEEVIEPPQRAITGFWQEQAERILGIHLGETVPAAQEFRALRFPDLQSLIERDTREFGGRAFGDPGESIARPPGGTTPVGPCGIVCIATSRIDPTTCTCVPLDDFGEIEPQPKGGCDIVCLATMRLDRETCTCVPLGGFGEIEPQPDAGGGTAPQPGLEDLWGLFPRTSPIGAAGTTVVQGTRRNPAVALLLLIAAGALGYYLYKRYKK